MAKFLKVLLVIVAGYFVGFLAGLGLVELLSTNSHDKSQEMGMTAIFFTGPIGAVVGLVWGIISARR